MSLLVLSQPSLGIELQMQSQATPVPGAAVAAARAASEGYAHAHTGYSVTIGSIMATNLQVTLVYFFYILIMANMHMAHKIVTGYRGLWTDEEASQGHCLTCPRDSQELWPSYSSQKQTTYFNHLRSNGLYACSPT